MVYRLHLCPSLKYNKAKPEPIERIKRMLTNDKLVKRQAMPHINYSAKLLQNHTLIYKDNLKH